jgi:hypothetical protein
MLRHAMDPFDLASCLFNARTRLALADTRISAQGSMRHMEQHVFLTVYSVFSCHCALRGFYFAMVDAKVFLNVHS